MAFPLIVDFLRGDPNWMTFLQAGVLTMAVGGFVAIATRSGDRSLTLHQSFLLTSGLWLVMPLVGAVPFMMGAPGVGFTDAYFEAMSGLTTTGVTAFPDLDGLPYGTHLWRMILQWSGGLGIVVVAMVFLPVMKVGGMQFFRSEGFDTLGKVLPRAGEIAADMTGLYLVITAACALLFIMTGMSPFDALIFALSTCSTGGFSNYDSSFAKYAGPSEWVASVFMILASIPFVRMVQLLRGNAQPIWHDPQVRAYLRWIFYAVAAIVTYRLAQPGQQDSAWHILRETTFNTISSFSGTGFGTADIPGWGHLPFALIIIAGLIGGCTGSTACSVKVFRYQVLFQAVRSQVHRMHSPHRIFNIRYDDRPLEQDVVDSVMSFFTLFILTFGLLIVGLALTGLHPKTALTAAWTSVTNVGFVWGPGLSSNGSVADLSGAAKWLMIVGMFLGRLELVSVLVLLLPRFWRG